MSTNAHLKRYQNLSVYPWKLNISRELKDILQLFFFLELCWGRRAAEGEAEVCSPPSSKGRAPVLFDMQDPV
jgi:hypothetical protein